MRWHNDTNDTIYYTLLVATLLHIISNGTSDVCFIKLFSWKVLYAHLLVIPRNIVINTKPVQKQESSTGSSKKRTKKRQVEKVRWWETTVAMKLDRWNVMSVSNTMQNCKQSDAHTKKYTTYIEFFHFLLHPQGVSIVPSQTICHDSF